MKMSWKEYSDTVDIIVSLIGEDGLEEATFNTLRWIRVSPTAFQRLCVGRTVEQKIENGWNTRWFMLANGATIRTMIAAPEVRLQASIVPGEPIDLERPIVAEAATDESVLCDEDHSDDDTVLSGEILASDSDAAVVESSL